MIVLRCREGGRGGWFGHVWRSCVYIRVCVNIICLCVYTVFCVCNSRVINTSLPLSLSPQVYTFPLPNPKKLPEIPTDVSVTNDPALV